MSLSDEFVFPFPVCYLIERILPYHKDQNDWLCNYSLAITRRIYFYHKDKILIRECAEEIN